MKVYFCRIRQASNFPFLAVAPVRIHVLTGFDNPLCSPERWEQLLRRSDTDVVFLTWQWLRAWWETVGEGELLLIAAERQGEVVALAPLYATDGMVFFLGAGESDYLDFLGDIGDTEVLAALLRAARQRVPDFIGFRFPLVPEQSRTGPRLQEAAGRLGLDWEVEAELPAVEGDLVAQAESVRAATQRSMRKREEFFQRHGSFEVRQLQDSEAIRAHLAPFYAQHVARWQVKDCPSPFADAGQRAFLERFLQLAAGTGWIRFLQLEWEGLPLAFEFAWYYRGTHFSGPWCFAIDQGRHCPGHVLLRQSLLAALDEGLTVYDLGGGDQDYKFRLPVRVKRSFTWGLYPE
jgi:CelD/BcsL family acetyltransferase involved in cellulose biosynthesis